MFRECERVAHAVAVVSVCMSACRNNVAQVMDSELDQFDQIEMNKYTWERKRACVSINCCQNSMRTCMSIERLLCTANNAFESDIMVQNLIRKHYKRGIAENDVPFFFFATVRSCLAKSIKWCKTFTCDLNFNWIYAPPEWSKKNQWQRECESDFDSIDPLYLMVYCNFSVLFNIVYHLAHSYARIRVFYVLNP